MVSSGAPLCVRAASSLHHVCPPADLGRAHARSAWPCRWSRAYAVRVSYRTRANTVRVRSGTGSALWTRSECLTSHLWPHRAVTVPARRSCSASLLRIPGPLHRTRAALWCMVRAHAANMPLARPPARAALALGTCDVRARSCLHTSGVQQSSWQCAAARWPHEVAAGPGCTRTPHVHLGPHVPQGCVRARCCARCAADSLSVCACASPC